MKGCDACLLTGNPPNANPDCPCVNCRQEQERAKWLEDHGPGNSLDRSQACTMTWAEPGDQEGAEALGLETQRFGPWMLSRKR